MRTGLTSQASHRTRTVRLCFALLWVVGAFACDEALDPVSEEAAGLDAFPTIDDVVEANAEETPTIPVNMRRATCGSPQHALQLPDHVTEADQGFAERIASLNPNALPREYDTTNLLELDLELIGYILDDAVPDRLSRDRLLDMGLLGKAVLLAFGGDTAPVMVDLKELRRGLYHYYNCSRGHPATLEGFISVYGDYTQWLSLDINDSYPKIYPRKLWINDELGVYVAETLRDGEVHETEVILSGYRKDGALEFLAYLPDGELTNRGEFRAGASFVAGASPYSCMACHRDPETGTYTKIFPNLTLKP